MADVIDINGRNPLLGTWRACDGFSDVRYTVSAEGGKLTVTGIDIGEGEIAQIYDVAWHEGKYTLEFSAYWPSTGRLTKNRFQPSTANNRADVTYTFTAQETWERV